MIWKAQATFEEEIKWPLTNPISTSLKELFARIHQLLSQAIPQRQYKHQSVFIIDLKNPSKKIVMFKPSSI
jgi:hypothetical protein